MLRLKSFDLWVNIKILKCWNVVQLPTNDKYQQTTVTFIKYTQDLANVYYYNLLYPSEIITRKSAEVFHTCDVYDSKISKVK